MGTGAIFFPWSRVREYPFTFSARSIVATTSFWEAVERARRKGWGSLRPCLPKRKKRKEKKRAPEESKGPLTRRRRPEREKRICDAGPCFRVLFGHCCYCCCSLLWSLEGERGRGPREVGQRKKRSLRERRRRSQQRGKKNEIFFFFESSSLCNNSKKLEK